VHDSGQTQELGKAEAPNSFKSLTDHVLDVGAQALQEITFEVAGQVLENVLVKAPKMVVETAACAVVDGLGSL
jgi:hypothetical protein